jgi:transposase
MLERLFIMDSTTISLFTDAMHGVGCRSKTGRKKGGAKAHVLMRAQDDVPCFVRITEGKVSDAQMLKHTVLPPGSIIVLDKGFNNYAHYQGWTRNEVTFITRMKENAVARSSHNRGVSENQRKLGVLTDCDVVLASPGNRGTTPLEARAITFHDREKNRNFVFLTNDRSHAPATIAALYKRRWQIELLFKRLKQGYPLRAFLGESPNAIKIQIWCALIADLLVKVVKDKVERATSRRWAFSNITSIIRQHLGTYVTLIGFLSNPEEALLHYRPPPENPIQFELVFD